MILCLERHILEFLDKKMKTIIMDEIELNLGDAKEGDLIVFGVYKEALRSQIPNPYETVMDPLKSYLNLSGYAKLGKIIKQEGNLVTWKFDVIRPFIFTRDVVADHFKYLFDDNVPYLVLDHIPFLKNLIEEAYDRNTSVELEYAYEILDELNSVESLPFPLAFYRVGTHSSDENELMSEMRKNKVYPPLDPSKQQISEDDLPF